MKRIGILIVAMILAVTILSSFSLISCKTTEAEETTETKEAVEEEVTEAEEATETEKYVIGFSQATMNHPWRVAMVEGNKKWIEENAPDVELIITDGQNDAANQVSDVEELIAREVDILVISPLQADALTDVVQRAMDAGIPVITLDRKVNIPVTLHIGAENYPIGILAADFINEKLNGEADIIIIQGTAGASATIDRQGGLVDTIEENYPGIEIIADQYADYLRENALKFMEDMLQRFGPGEIDAVYTHNDEMALGAIEAIKSADRLDEMLVIGIDGEELAFEAIKAGELDVTFIYPFCAPEGMIYAYQLLKGEQLPGEIVLESAVVTADNVEEYLGKGF